MVCVCESVSRQCCVKLYNSLLKVKMDVFEDGVRVGVRGQVGFIHMKYSIFICH